MTGLKERYNKTIAKKLAEEFKLSNVHEIPKLVKVVVSRGIGKEAIDNSKAPELNMNELTAITGQKPKLTLAKKAIATFKLRKGLPVGCFVTLRGDRMYLFVEKFINISLPKIRDFRGVPNRGFDEGGNYTLGMKEQLIFPEIKFDAVDKTRGMDITFVIKSKGADQSKRLLQLMGMPFRKD
jgi:large subunit ribosomal protein L5